ncbi:xanthine dehydrogenase family protein subunit M [Geodermatophilus sp. DSM 45219]|uniref:FAD binding domain-containing protein n=1 Tax=Geodermatophilus sp. DSM 45219 TaxID=1881103 RepID=UPI0008870CFF|nr:FAD binding domain-containing protein [Geodermatophilus sp. DSM 45219]SDO22795.1 CO or xanthine dehydrogenase, FAD-binding subunit [Geodermatophilus sp. DSM 45219]
MDFLQPSSWDEALALRAERPDALPISGGTDVMVELNFDRRRPGALLDLTRVGELREWSLDGGTVRLGAGVPYARVITELGAQLPGLAMASRTVGSPQIRVRGTVGGNLGSASPAGDAHPPLLAAGAEVEVASAARGPRRVPVAEFFTGVKRNALEPDELIAAVLVRTARGPQQFCKVGTRNAMVISVSAFALALHPDRQAVGTGIGSAAPTPRRAPEAEEFLAGALDWAARSPLPDGLARAFGERVAAAASPIDDVRGTAAYRRHSLAVLARRAVTWAWDDLRRAA